MMVTREDATWIQVGSLSALLMEKGLITPQEFQASIERSLNGLTIRGWDEEDVRAIRNMIIPH
ncbi:hypothetical protein [Clostridium sp. C8-1-8]|uniref:hypothetical protein n=1 Tax=Clostridium sp. C8-1-8 TaxID=2698831 RepID=UPI00136D9375|nr:hypothetical protein [Clostridium sp. C8-1-8]